jgi:hypothetical protein
LCYDKHNEKQRFLLIREFNKVWLQSIDLSDSIDEETLMMQALEAGAEIF